MLNYLAGNRNVTNLGLPFSVDRVWMTCYFYEQTEIGCSISFQPHPEEKVGIALDIDQVDMYTIILVL